MIGIFSDEGGDNEERKAFIPITTAQMMYGNNDYISEIVLGYDPNLSTDRAIAFGNQMERDLRKRMNIHPDDQSALVCQKYGRSKQRYWSVYGYFYMLL